MLYEESEYLDLFNFAKEMFSSIRGISVRIDELKWIVNSNVCREDRRKEVVERIKRLKETKLNLIYSMCDKRRDILKVLDRTKENDDCSFDVESLYEELKRL
jgi:uncharacterized coiled-coil DUF342 family protein